MIESIDPHKLGSIIKMLEDSVNQNTNQHEEDGEVGPEIVIEHDGIAPADSKEQHEMEVTADHITLQPPMSILKYSSADSFSNDDDAKEEMLPPKAFTVQPTIELIRYQSHESKTMPDIPEDDVFCEEENVDIAISSSLPPPQEEQQQEKKHGAKKEADSNVMKQFAENAKEIMALCKELGLDPMDKDMFDKLAKGDLGKQSDARRGTFDNLNGIEIVNVDGSDFQFKI